MQRFDGVTVTSSGSQNEGGIAWFRVRVRVRVRARVRVRVRFGV